MNTKVLGTTAGALGMLLCTLPASAENQETQNQAMQNREMAAPGSQQGQRMAKSELSKGEKNNKRSEFQAKVISTKRVQYRGRDEEHLLAKVRLSEQQGSQAASQDSANQEKTFIVDFGSVSTLQKQKAEVQQGQEVRVQGQEGRINRQPVLFVYAFDVLPETGQTQQTSQQNTQQRQQMASNNASNQRLKSRDVQVIEGKIVDMTDVRVKGLSDRQRLLRVERKNDGEPFVVSAGTKADLDKLALEKGDTALIKGVGGKINNRNVIFATQIAEVASIQTQIPEHLKEKSGSNRDSGLQQQSNLSSEDSSTEKMSKNKTSDEKPRV